MPLLTFSIFQRVLKDVNFICINLLCFIELNQGEIALYIGLLLWKIQLQKKKFTGYAKFAC
jgi:hypothetical protein